MGKAPAAIIIARHGARLDAEDKTWLANSATPYDPPLSYGGWTQTRALGGRIASLLHERDLALNDQEAAAAARRRGSEDLGVKASDNGDNPPIASPRRRKHKVIIHSSPFLRCVQSSIAISAGMAQYQGNLARFEAKSHAGNPSRTVKPARLFTAPGRSQTLDSTELESRYNIPPASPGADKGNKHAAVASLSQFMKPTLRIDACLGEWLSPDYFEFITAPPSSDMMIAGAKVDLLRIATPLQGARTDEDRLPEPPPLDLDGRSVTESIDHLSLSEAPQAAPQQQSSTNGIPTSPISNKRAVRHIPGSRHKSFSKGYVPPLPSYAISTTEAIPQGYVGHARDACVKIDFQWDSMREPQGWGDGGEHGEEWSAMHRRFRRGLMSMITWYKLRGPYYDPQAEGDDPNPEDAMCMDEDEDIILVLVTHGAGCNALIGALTNQPVLLDVGMASLTMAVRKEPSSFTPSPQFAPPVVTSRRRRSSIDVSQSEEYEMRLVASNDHLRAGTDPLKIPQLQSPRALTSIPERASRGEGSTVSGSSRSSTPGHAPERPRNSALGSVRRTRATTTTTTPPGGSRQTTAEYFASHSVQNGLWGSRQFSAESPEINPMAEASEGEEMDDSGGDTAPEQVRKSSKGSTWTAPNPNLNRSASQRGLWGSETRKQPTRRWTVVEQH